MTRQLSATEERLIDIMTHTGTHEVVAVGIVETRAALRIVEWGWAEVVAESDRSVDQWGAGSLRIRWLAK
jgi:hypothetical protein